MPPLVNLFYCCQVLDNAIRQNGNYGEKDTVLIICRQGGYTLKPKRKRKTSRINKNRCEFI